MPAGVSFQDVLDDALRAGAWETAGADEPQERTSSIRHAVYPPLITLHTVTIDADRIKAAAAAYGTGTRRRADTAGVRPPRPSNAAFGTNGDRGSASTLHERSFGVAPAGHAPRRPPRVLTEAQRQSLAALNRLGAGMRSDFSAGELRSAFRLLARRYHPDRHPGATDGARERLSQQFAIVRSSYETLRTALDGQPG